MIWIKFSRKNGRFSPKLMTNRQHLYKVFSFMDIAVVSLTVVFNT